MNHRIVLVLGLLGTLFWFQAATAADQKPIEGDFGRYLGEVFHPGEAKAESAAEGFPLYPFQPAEPNPAFKDFFLQVTPLSNKIFSILAIGPAASPSACRNEQDRLMDTLQKEFGAPQQETLAAPDFTIKVITVGNNTVQVKCSQLGEGSIEIQYTDLTLKDQAETEKIGKEGR